MHTLKKSSMLLIETNQYYSGYCLTGIKVLDRNLDYFYLDELELDYLISLETWFSLLRGSRFCGYPKYQNVAIAAFSHQQGD